MSVERENLLRRFVGLPPLLIGEAPVCPFHGTVHSTVCNASGPVREVVVLREGQYVAQERKPGKPRKKYWTIRLDLDLKARCEAAGLKPKQVLEDALNDYEMEKAQ